MNKIHFPKFIISILVCQAAGIIGSFFTVSEISAWYANLIKPDFTPPGWIFGPVWIFLYLLMGIALYLVWVNPSKSKKAAFWFFGIQLFLNSMWSILFFGLHNPLFALIDLGILLIAVLVTIWQFWKINVKSAILLLPYLAWGVFALLLNFLIWKLNF